MAKRKKSRKSRIIKQIDVLNGVRKSLPPPTVVYLDKRNKRARIVKSLDLDSMGLWVGPGDFGP